MSRKYDIICVTLELTYSCNFSCIHCYVHGAVVTPCFFDIANLAVLLDFLNEYEVQRVYLMGGEPLLHPDFNLIYSVLYDNGFQVALTTNGALISNAIVELFKSKPPAILQISIYGFSKTDVFRGYAY